MMGSGARQRDRVTGHCHTPGQAAGNRTGRRQQTAGSRQQAAGRQQKQHHMADRKCRVNASPAIFYNWTAGHMLLQPPMPAILRSQMVILDWSVIAFHGIRDNIPLFVGNVGNVRNVVHNDLAREATVNCVGRGRVKCLALWINLCSPARLIQKYNQYHWTRRAVEIKL